MNHQFRADLLWLVALSALSTGCGSEGSLASSGSNDWKFEGSARPGAAGGGGARGTQAPPPGGAPGGATVSGGAGSVAGGAAAGSSTAGTSATTGGASPGGMSPGGANPGAKYHQLPNWTEPQASNPNHHGRIYFLGNAHKDENGAECTSCHGQNYEGDAGPACATCHAEWRSSCTFCHGTAGALGGAPPRGIWDETSTASLAVGRHAAHLSAGTSHPAFACTTCHEVPKDNDVDHTLGYSASTDLSTAGHHGDVVLASVVPGMTWNVDATSGAPVSARGGCVGGCHSNGRGGPPAKAAYWAGGTWASGCGNCHAARPTTGHHDHALDEGGTCANCHAGSTTTAYSGEAHLNGQTEYLGTIAGQGMTLTADANCASGVRCNGRCHGNDEGHNNKCW
jgi:hypothetical protein